MIDMMAPFSPCMELVNLGVYVTGFNILDDRMTKLDDDGNQTNKKTQQRVQWSTELVHINSFVFC